MIRTNLGILRSQTRRRLATVSAALGLLGFLVSVPPRATGAALPPPVDRKVDYQADIQPLLVEHCSKCHGPEKQKSNLRLDTPEGLLRGGESGEPVFVAGHSATSRVIQLVAGLDPKLVMPFKGERLSSEQVGLLRAWIDQGAHLPGNVTVQNKLTTDHWSFQPVKRPPLPPSDDPFVRNEIDAFILAQLRQNGLEPSEPAGRATFIRRLYLVMHGLPPTPAEVDEFLNDRRPNAVPELVERVLASPCYGERWARHWLDVVRYADSNGFETNRERKNAYPYRDYVIQALNDDLPYDQFVKEQIAGDALGADAATGFLVAGPYDIVKSPDVNLTLAQRQDELADMVNTTGTAFLGLTLGCARCHNHKFDPILQKDYYSLQAVFAGVQYGDRPLPKKLTAAENGKLAALKKELPKAEHALALLREEAAARQKAARPDAPRRPAVNARQNTEEFAPVTARAVRFTIFATSAGSEPCLDELEIYDETGRNVALASNGATASASGTLPGYAIHQLKHVNDGLHGNAHSWISNTGGHGWVQIDFPVPQRVRRIVWGRDRDEQFKDRLATNYRIEASAEPGSWILIASSADREPYAGSEDPNAFLTFLSEEEAVSARRLQETIRELKSRLAGLSEGRPAWVGNFAQPGPTHRLYRGDPLQPREVVAPDALTVLGTLGMAVDEPEQQRRLRLAEWIASPQNPLTARVLVNRLWHYIFGTGIVGTPSDFGANGLPPSNPELLDWLADEFVKSGWSIKHIQRLILNSNTFRQSSRPRPAALSRDAACRFLWRFPPRRLEGEAIRDCILAASGALDLHMGGPGFYLLDVQVENVMHYFPKEEFGPPEFRRMVYQFKIRQEQDAIFGSFDCPDGNQVIPRRSRSNTPLQALNLFNSSFVLQQAGFLARRLKAEAGSAPPAQVERAFLLLYARHPDAFEREASCAVIREQGLEAFCRALYNTSEFLFVF
jgi:mono/diheme cytochrome c family protein